MASQVPYTGTQDVGPQERDLAPVHIDTPVAAFGGAVAGAITHMGEVAEGAGKELFARAYAMQQLNQTDIANNGVANYQNDLTKSWVDFSKNQGQDAINKLPDFMDQTEKMRQDYASKMPSPEAAFLFNQESRQARFRTVFSAGNYAREEMKKFGRESSGLRIDSIGDNAAISGGDPAILNPAVDAAKREAGLNAERQGFHPGTPEYDQSVKMGGSSVYGKTVREVMKTEPLRAQGMLEDGVKSGKLTETDAANLAPMVKRAVDAQAARSTGTGILNGTVGDWGAKPVTTSRATEVLTKSSGTGGYNLIGPEDPNGNGHPVGHYGVPSSDLSRWLKDSGMPAMTEQEFLANPKAQDQLAQTKFPALQTQYGSFDEAMKVWSGGIDTDNRLKQAHKALADSASHSELNQKAEQAGNTLQPNDPEFTEGVQNHVISERSRNDAFLARDKFDNGNTVYDALTGVASPNGKVPTSLPELLADPKVREAYDKLDAKGQNAIQKGIVKNIREGGFAPTPAGQAMYEKLYGIGVSPDATPEERQKLIDTDPANLEMPLAQRQTIQRLRAKVFDQAIANPNLTHAMQVMAPILQSYNITHSADPDRYVKFQGALRDAMQGEATGTKQPVKSDDDIKRIGTQLLQANKSQAGWFSTPKMFEVPGNNTDRQQASDAFRKVFNRDPTDDEIGTILLRKAFELAGGKPKMTVKPNP